MSSNIFKNNSYIKKISCNDVNGVDFLNILSSDTELGKFLNPDNITNIPTLFGDIASARRGMEFFNRIDYPINLVNKTKLNKKDIKTIKNLPIAHIPNYKIGILYLVYKMVKTNPKICELLKENSLDFVALTKVNIKDALVAVTATTHQHVYKLTHYISCVRIVSTILKESDDPDNTISKMFSELGLEFFINEFKNINKMVS